MNENFFIVGGMIALVVAILLYVWTAMALSAVFRKAGEAGWQAWVPGYNLAIVLRLGGFSPWLVFIAFVPLFGWIAYPVLHFISCHRIGRAFGHGAAMTVLAVLFPVWATLLGYGSSRWIGSEHAIPRREGPAPVASAESAPPLLSPWDPPAPRSPTTPAFPEAAPASAPLTGGFWGSRAAETPSAGFPAAAATASVPPPLRPIPPAPPSVPAAPTKAPFADAVSPVSLSASLAGMPSADAPETRRAYRGDLVEGDDDAVDPEDRAPEEVRPSATFLPPEPSAPAVPPATERIPPIAPIESVPLTRPAPEPQETPPLPVSSVPEAPDAERPGDPWVPGAAPRKPAPEEAAEGLPELSEAVSAVAGAPDAGSPRSARSSVSALYAPAQPEEDDEAFDRTIVARRRRIPWTLVAPGAPPVEITSDVVILGRRPAPDAARPGAQLIAIADDTRTVSKTHARLELREDTWYVTDLGSTNGVLFATLMGTEVEAPPGQELEAGERFFLGDAEVRLKRSDG